MQRSKRINFRLNQELFQLLAVHCQQRDVDTSRAIREALDLYLNGKPSEKESAAVLVPPQEVFRVLPPYLAWGKGDLREERSRVFLECLAVSLACKRLYSR